MFENLAPHDIAGLALVGFVLFVGIPLLVAAIIHHGDR